MASGSAKGSRDSKDGIKLRGDNWYENFFVPGYPRFRGCLRTNDRETAVKLVAAKKAALLLGTYKQAKPEITLDEAIGRHWQEQQQYWHSATNAVSYNKTLLRLLGKETRVHSLGFGPLSTYVAERRGKGVKNVSVNRELAHLRSILNACKAWGYRMPDSEIPFRTGRGPQLWLPEPDKRPAALSEADEAAFFRAIRPDFHPVIRFGLLTGLRRENACGLRWDQIRTDGEADWIEVRTKSKKPGRKLQIVDLTPQLKALLSLERGNHPEYVFTWLVHQTQRLSDGTRYEAGQRLPIVYRGGDFPAQWRRAREAVGLPRLRFHDLRHTFATNLAKLVPLTVVQAAMGHADIRTTMIYQHVDRDSVLAARLKLEEARALRVVGQAIEPGTDAGHGLNTLGNDSPTNPEQTDAHPVHKAEARAKTT